MEKKKHFCIFFVILTFDVRCDFDCITFNVLRIHYTVFHCVIKRFL
jgi:hypothetical protein